MIKANPFYYSPMMLVYKAGLGWTKGFQDSSSTAKGLRVAIDLIEKIDSKCEMPSYMSAINDITEALHAELLRIEQL
jgi:hypothetical protein